MFYFVGGASVVDFACFVGLCACVFLISVFWLCGMFVVFLVLIFLWLKRARQSKLLIRIVKLR